MCRVSGGVASGHYLSKIVRSGPLADFHNILAPGNIQILHGCMDNEVRTVQ